MNRRVKQLIKKFALFIVLFILRHLADYLPDATLESGDSDWIRWSCINCWN